MIGFLLTNKNKVCNIYPKTKFAKIFIHDCPKLLDLQHLPGLKPNKNPRNTAQPRTAHGGGVYGEQYLFPAKRGGNSNM